MKHKKLVLQLTDKQFSTLTAWLADNFKPGVGLFLIAEPDIKTGLLKVVAWGDPDAKAVFLILDAALRELKEK